MNMNNYLSTSSTFVKTVTAGTLTAMTLIVVALTLSESNNGMIWGTALTGFVIGTAFYFYANALNKVVVHEDRLVIKRNLGQIEIKRDDVQSVTRMDPSNLNLTSGSKGVFGFVGSTMDNTYSLVKDRSKMVKITTSGKNYLVSVDQPDKLVAEAKEVYGLG